jgi:hypothetical protein
MRDITGHPAPQLGGAGRRGVAQLGDLAGDADQLPQERVLEDGPGASVGVAGRR